MKQNETLRLRGNLSAGAILSKAGMIPPWLYALRGSCFLFDSFAAAAAALEEHTILPASVIVIRKRREADAFSEVQPEKQFFSEAFSRSERVKDSILLAEDEETAAGMEGLCFYLEKPAPGDLFYRIETGDVLDYQIPAGNFTLDLPEPGRTARLGGCGQDDYGMTELSEGIRSVQDRYTRLFLVKGEKRGLMIDCGFGRGDLKKLQQDFFDGEWMTALTHGHGDHAAGCRGFAHLYGSRRNLKNAGIDYRGQLTELEDGMIFDLGGRKATVLLVPGHSAADACFYVEPENVLISGDAIAAGPSYTMTEGGSVSRWIASLERLLSMKMPVTAIYCSHREGILEASAIREMHRSLLELEHGDMERFGASVYGFGRSFWQTNGRYSFFTAPF